MERDVFTKIAPLGEMYGFEFKGYFVDAGTPLLGWNLVELVLMIIVGIQVQMLMGIG